MTAEALRARMRRAYLWTLIGQGGGFLLYLSVESTRSHLLSPDQVGVVVAGLWLFGLAQSLGDMGLGAAIIRRHDLSDRQITAVSDAIAMASFIGTLLVALLAPVLAWWNRNADVEPVIVVLAPLFLVQGVGVIYHSLLTRELNFRAIVRADLLGSLAQLGAIATLGWIGLGAWALVASLLLGQTVRTLLLRCATNWRPVRPADWSVIRPLLDFGANVAGGRTLFYAYSNADYLLLGRWWPAAVLGVYYSGFRLATLSSSGIASVFNQVVFPAFVTLSTNHEALRRHYLSTVRTIAVLSFPATVGLAVVAPDAVMALYGPQWLAAVPITRLLCIMALTRSLEIVGPNMLLAKGLARANLWISVGYTCTLIPALLVGVSHGALGVATAWVAVAVPIDLTVLYLVSRTVKLDAFALIRTLGPVAIRSAVMALVVAAVASSLPAASQAHEGQSLWAGIRLLVEVGAGALVYGAWTLASEPSWRGSLRFVRGAVASEPAR